MEKQGNLFYYAALIFFFLLAFFPMLALSFFNQPSPADDYCYIDTVQKYGFWQAQKFYYDGWSGRYFAYFLAHGNPLLYGFPAGFKLYSILLILFFLASSYRLGATLLTPGRGRKVLAGFMMTLFALYVFYVPSIAEGFFWMITSLTNTLPVLLLFWIPGLLPWSNEGKNYPPSRLLLTSLLIFAIVGCGEIALLVTGLLLFYALAYLFLTRQRIAPQWWALLVVFALSAYFQLAAPGNQVRMDGNEMSGDPLYSLFGAFALTFISTGKWLLQTPLLIATLLFLAVALKPGAPSARTRFPAVHPLFIWAGFFSLLAACFFPIFYGGLAKLGVLDPPERNFNTVYLLFLAGWFFCVLATTEFINRKNPRFLSLPVSSRVSGLLVLVMLIYAYQSPNLKPIYRDLRKGTAYRYDQQIKQRYRLIADAQGDTVLVAPLRDLPASLYIDDIRVENEHLWNRCYSGYFGKTVILDTLRQTDATR